MQQQTNITLSAVIPLSSTEVPIYSVSHDGNNCKVNFNQSYLVTPQILARHSHTTVDGNYLYDVASKEKVSTYLNDAASLAQQLLPQPGAPVLASIAQVASSKAATDLSAAVNQTFSQHSQVSGALLHDLDDSGRTRKHTFAYKLQASKVENGVITSSTDLANIYFTVEHETTLFGNETDGLPTYELYGTRNARVVMLKGGSFLQGYVYDEMNSSTNNQSATNVENAGRSGENAVVVQGYCNALRKSLQQFGLNAYDETAFLWALYTRSPYSRGEDLVHKSDCMSNAELNIVKQLNLQSWLSENFPPAPQPSAPLIPAPRPEPSPDSAATSQTTN